MSESSDGELPESLPTTARNGSSLAKRIDALFRRFERARFLEPDAALVLGRAEAIAEVDALGEALADALSSAVLRGVPSPSRPVSIARSLDDAAQQWLDGWTNATNAVAADELWSLAIEHRAAFAEVLPRAQRLAIQQRLEDAHDALRLRSPSLAHRWIDGLAPYTMLVARQLEWLAAGRAEASPFTAAMELFERGAWPMLLPDGAVLVWAPDRALAGEPPESWLATRASINELAEREPRSALARCALLGLGPRLVARDREGTSLVLALPDTSEIRVELGPLTIASHGRGSDARITGPTRGQWGVLAIDRDALIVEHSRGLSARRGVTATGCTVGARARIGEIELRVERDARSDAPHEARALLHTSECASTRSYAEQRGSDKTSMTAVQWAARSATRAMDASSVGASAKSLIDAWTTGPGFEPPAATSDDRAALAWVEARARALFGAVHRSAECAPSAPADVTLERSFVRAAQRVEQAWRDATKERVTVRSARILFGLDQLLREQRARAASATDASRSGGSVLLLARVLQRNAIGWSRDVLPFAARFAGIDAGAVASIAQRAALAGIDDEANNPWALMVSLWQRGALFWPMPDNGALVFVPRGDAQRGLVINPDDEPPPSLPSPNFVASLLFAGAEPHSLVTPDWFDLVRRRTRATTSNRPAPEAHLASSPPWVWAGRVRVAVGEGATVDDEGRIADAPAAGRQVIARIMAIDGEHWVVAEPRRRELLVVNGRTVRARPLAHGDVLALTREARPLFEGRYECPAQRMR
ncbi:MAG: hypothetical protein JNK05_23265 [Myxococcales bacterium]|nr:hypothetical protein [Myxococcales bacterium]